MTYGILALLIILIASRAGFNCVGLVFYVISGTAPLPKADVKTQPIVQRFISRDLKKRAFIVRLNEGGYKVIFQRYSEEVINLAGEGGWLAGFARKTGY